jgi:hypothetical protein
VKSDANMFDIHKNSYAQDYFTLLHMYVRVCVNGLFENNIYARRRKKKCLCGTKIRKVVRMLAHEDTEKGHKIFCVVR